MSSSAQSKLAIKWIVTIAVPLLFMLIPTSELFSMQLKLFLTITVMSMLMLCFELMDSFWVAIFMPGMWILFGVCSAADAFASWTQTQVWMVIGGYLLAAALDQCGVLNRFAYWCLQKCRGNFNRILYVFFFVGVILAFLTFANVFMIVFLLSYSICKVFKQDKTKGAAVIMMVAQLAGVNAGVYVCNPQHFAFFQAGIQSVLPEFEIQWYHQIIYSIPLFFISLIVIYILTKIFHTKDITSEDALQYFNDEYEKMGKMSAKEKKATVITLALIVWLFSSSFIDGIDGNLGLILFPLLFFLPGINVADKDAFKRVNFGMVVFVASCMSIGAVGISLGLGDIVSEFLFPIMSKIPTFLTPVAVLVFGILANLVMTPAAMFALFPAPLTQIAVDIGMSTPWPMTLPLLYSLDLVFFPYEQALCLILFGFGVVKMSDYIKISSIRIGIFLVCFMLLVIPYWLLMGLF